MKTCKTCVYWKINKEEYDPIANPEDQDGGFMKMPFEVRKCEQPNQTLFERNPNIDGISLNDGSEYHAALYTGEKFGCINHKTEGKTNEN